MKYYQLLICLFVNICYAQNIDSIQSQIDSIQYDSEIDFLKSRLENLEKKFGVTDSVQKKEFGLLQQTRINMFVLMRMGELDWDQKVFNQQTQKGERVHPRFWSRPMFYVFLNSQLSEDFDFRFSFQNYPFSIFGGDTDFRLALVLAEIWLRYKIDDHYSLKFGRQDVSNIWDNQIGTQFDFWQHDGLSFKTNHDIGKLDLTTQSAFFLERYVNNAPFKEQGKLYGMSAKLENKTSRTPWHISTGLMRAESLPNTYYSSIGQFFYDGDLAKEYTIFLSQLSVRFKNFANLAFTFDFFHNFNNYKNNPQSSLIRDVKGETNIIRDADGNYSENKSFDASTAPNFRNQKSGFYGSVSSDLPFISKDLRVSAGYLYMQKYAALDFFAQYDLARWASTNVKGPEFMIKYKLNDRISFRNRTFFIKEIKGLNGVDPGFVREGNRTRFDIIINF